MSVGKNSIKRAAGKTAVKTEEKKLSAVKDECPKAAPELANSCSTPAKATKKAPAKKASAKKAPAKAPAKEIAAPVAEEKKTAVSVTEALPYWLL